MADLQFFKQDKFKECYHASKDFKIADDVSVKVLQLITLIEEKEKSTRPKDNLDAGTLKKLYRL